MVVGRAAGWLVVFGAVAAGCAGSSASPPPLTTAISAPPLSVAASQPPLSSRPPSASTLAPASSIASTVATEPECVQRLPVTWKAGQVLMPAVFGDQLDSVREPIVSLQIGGAMLLSWPADATAEELRVLKEAQPVPVLIAVDEEGGTVQRRRSLGRLPSARQMAATMSPEAVGELIRQHAEAVRSLGIDVVFAPVLDVAMPGGGGPIGSRTFGDQPEVVVSYGGAVAEAWRDAGIIAVFKHFPGHGRASADSHTGASSTPPLAELLAVDLVPFVELLGDGEPGAVMVGHLDVPGLTDGGPPSSMSAAVIEGLLRDRLGFADTLVFTDDLAMTAVAATYPAPQAAVLSLAAGADMVVYTDFARSAEMVDAIVAALADSSLTASRLDRAVEHILAAKGVDPCEI